MSTQFCFECFSPTDSTYFVGLKKLCSKCAKIHGEEEIKKLNKEKEEINNKISNIRKHINDTIIADCKHENAFDTNYGHVTKEGFITIWRCPDCDFTFNKLHEFKVR